MSANRPETDPAKVASRSGPEASGLRCPLATSVHWECRVSFTAPGIKATGDIPNVSKAKLDENLRCKSRVDAAAAKHKEVGIMAAARVTYFCRCDNWLLQDSAQGEREGTGKLADRELDGIANIKNNARP